MRLRKIIYISLVISFCTAGCSDSNVQQKYESQVKNKLETSLRRDNNDHTIVFRSFSVTKSESQRNMLYFEGKYVSKRSLGGGVSGFYNYKKEQVKEIYFVTNTVFNTNLEIDGQALSSTGDPLRNTKLKFRTDESDTLGTVSGRERPPFETTTDSSGHFHCKGVPYGRWFVSAIVEQSDGTQMTINLGGVRTGAWDVKLTQINEKSQYGEDRK